MQLTVATAFSLLELELLSQTAAVLPYYKPLGVGVRIHPLALATGHHVRGTEKRQPCF